MAAAALRIHALGGAGEPVLLIHGFAGDCLSWLANQHELARIASVHAVELPGHGDERLTGEATVSAFADAVAASLAEAGIGPVHLIGHSLGGAVAVALAAEHPSLVRSIALIAPAGLGRGADSEFVARLPEARTAEELEPLLHSIVSRPRLINRQMVARVLAQLDEPGRREAYRAIGTHLGDLEATLADRTAFLAASPLPRLVVWGELDRTNPLDRERLAAFGGEQMIVEGAAHMPHVEAQRVVNERLLAFIEASSGIGN
jgi:pimeloyl-ACP methyl ester carboxylesterase